MAQSPAISIHIPGDQLLDAHPALTAAEETTDRKNIRVVMVESAWKRRSRPYHKQKLVLVISAMRHFAERLREQGYTVDYIFADTMTAGLRQHVERHRPAKLLCMAAADYVPRQIQTDALAHRLGIEVEVMPNTQFLVGQWNGFADRPADEKVIMEYFYRDMRRHFRVLMDGNQPAGGDWNYDKLNREPLPRDHVSPLPPHFAPDAVTRDVMTLMERESAAGMLVTEGALEGFGYAVTHADADAAFQHFLDHRLSNFGAYEDAMSIEQPYLYHSIISPYINLGLLEPLDLVRRAEAEYREGRAPLNSVEGFTRQIIGWREFMYWSYWRQMPELVHKNGWEAHRPMPAFFWGKGDDLGAKMRCLSDVVAQVKTRAYTHHIERLMLVTNFCTLAGIEPQAVFDWFMRFYIDAYDWVMQTNVVGMGLNADGGIIGTKPYISTANYIDKMSDYCEGCYFERKTRTGERACPYNLLYWNFLLEHEDVLRKSPRLGNAVLGLRHLKPGESDTIRADAKVFLDGLSPYSE